MIRLVAALALCPLAAHAELSMNTVRYTCERGVEVPVTYVSDGADGVAVLTVEGRQISLFSEPADAGARYGWPSDGSNYVWLTKGADATLNWKDGTSGTEAALLTGCMEQQ